MRNWPKEYADWADGDVRNIARQKKAAILDYHGVMELIESPEFVDCLESQWPKELHTPIRNLILTSFMTFWESTQRGTKKSRTEVSHIEFIDTLDQWLNEHSDLEDKFSTCPFKPGTFSLLFLCVSSRCHSQCFVFPQEAGQCHTARTKFDEVCCR